MNASVGFSDAELLSVLPKLRAHAVKMTKHRPRADDLIQDTVEMMLRHKARYTAGNLMAWGYTIMRNLNRSHQRKCTEWQLGETAILASPVANDDQAKVLEIKETLSNGLSFLGDRQKQVVMLIGVQGYDYLAASKIMGVAEGTTKSAMHRARQILETCV